jgi:hypothetical protein
VIGLFERRPKRPVTQAPAAIRHSWTENRATNAEINRELSAIRRAFSLGIQSGKILMHPYSCSRKTTSQKGLLRAGSVPIAEVETGSVVATARDFRVHYWLADPDQINRAPVAQLDRATDF